MVREPQDGSLDHAVGELIGRAALGAVVGALLLLALGLLAEALRRRHRARRLVAVLDLTIPTWVRTAILSLLALMATFTGIRPVSATDSVRGWLGQSNVTTTSTTAATSTTAGPIATPDAISERDAVPPTTAPTGPVVLIPPVTVERDDPPPATPPVTIAPSPVPVAPQAPSSAPPAYVVQRGDCLWSIAERLLGPGATGAAIDRSWRRIYATNLAAIGGNPNLIHIGLSLTLPPLDAQP